MSEHVIGVILGICAAIAVGGPVLMVMLPYLMRPMRRPPLNVDLIITYNDGTEDRYPMELRP